MHCKINHIFKIVCVSVAFNLQLSFFTSTAQQVRSFEPLPRFSAQGYSYSMPETNWVDSVMQSLTLEQRIAQLMVVRVPLDMDDMAAAAFSKKMNGYGVGGVCFFAGTAERQAEMTRRFQADAKVPLLVNIDAEWGLGMRLKDMYSFPRNARFGQLPDYADSIVYRMGEEIGRQCRMMGIHVNYAPVVDINSNPKNPVIGTRSYGVDRERVARLGILFAKGLQSMGVMAVAKHFPGHGDTETDSHFDLPVINHTRAYMDTVALLPFRRLIEAGVEQGLFQHGEGRQQIACDGRPDPAHHGDSGEHEHRQNRTDYDLQRRHPYFFFLSNIFSIRCVTPKPPNTLTAASTMAKPPANWAQKPSPARNATPVATMAPTIVTPDRAFMPDISGV
jgi:hypothetical protein